MSHYPPSHHSKAFPKMRGWIQWFLALEDHEFYLEVEKEFVEDKMNLVGLR